MRVAEHGLRALAKKLRVALTYKGKHQPIEFADWEKMITAIRNKVNTARETFSGKKRAETIQRYSDLADHCSYMKDIWRNEVSHTRKPYVDREALIVLQRVRGFMGALVQQL
jgi:hypothetical protein